MLNTTYSVSNKKSQLSVLVLLAFFTLAVFGLSQLYGSGTGAAPIGPGGVDDAGLTLWLDADDASTVFQDRACTGPSIAGASATGSGDVGCWLDKSGQNNHVTVTTDEQKEPNYLANELNGRPTLNFDTDALVAPDADQITSNSSYTKFVVYSTDVGSSGAQNLISSSTTNSHAFLAPGGNLATWHGGTFLSSGAQPHGAYYVGTTRYAAPDSGTNILNVDGVELDSNTTIVGLTNVTPTQIGNHDNGSDLDGKIAEAIIYDRALTDAEINQVECYLGTKWGLDVDHCPSPGGVDADLALWLKASDGVSLKPTGSGVDAWTDQVNLLTLNDARPGDAQHVANSTDFNFNPAVDFTSGLTQLTANNTTFLGTDHITASVYAVTHGVGGADRETVFIYKNSNANSTNSTGTAANGVVGLELNGSAYTNDTGVSVAASGVNDGTHLSTLVGEDVNFIRTYHLDGAVNTSGNSAQNREINANEDQLSIGSYGGGGHPFDGSLAELIIYDETAGDQDRQQIESYLALKYGITLDQTTALSYLDSDGSNVWVNDGDGYEQDIFGISKDNGSGLDQRISKSVNDDSILTVSTDTDFAGANTSHTDALGDGDALVIANNDSGNDATTTQGTELPGEYGVIAAGSGASGGNTPGSLFNASTGSDFSWAATTNGSFRAFDARWFASSPTTADITITNTATSQSVTEVAVPVTNTGAGSNEFVVLSADITYSAGDIITWDITFADDSNVSWRNTDPGNPGNEIFSWASGFGAINEAGTNLYAYNGLTNTRTAREWKVDNTGGVGEVHLKFDGYGDTWQLIVDTDGNFTNAASAGFLDANGEIAAALPHGTHFTLASFESTPGGVGDSLNLWLKADAGVNGGATVDEWEDQSGNDAHFTAAGTARPDATNGEINFNPSLYFDGVNDRLDNNDRAYGSGTINDASFYGVYTLDKDASTSFGGSNPNFTRLTHYTSQTFADAQSNGGTNRVGGAGGVLASEYGTPYLFGFNHQTTGGQLQEINKNGELVVSDNTAVPFTAPLNSYIGSSGGTQERLQGNLSEIIAYPTKLSLNDQQKVESYLALKYGITLSQSTATDYLASDGTAKIWSAGDNTGYDNDIFGIGRDDTSALGQVKSKSVNPDAIVTVEAAGEGTNAANAFTDFADLEFLTIANDNDNDGTIETQTTELSNSANFTIPAATGVANTQMVFDWGGAGHPFSVWDGRFKVTDSAASTTPLTSITFAEGETKTLYIIGAAYLDSDSSSFQSTTLGTQISVTNTDGELSVTTSTPRFRGFSETATSYETASFNDLPSGGSAVTMSQSQTNFVFNGGKFDKRLDREWKIDEEGDVGNVDLDFDLTGHFNATDTITLLVNTSSDFSGGVTQAVTATSWDGTTATFDDLTLADADFFTVAATSLPPVDIEFEAATTSDAENTGGSIPSLLIDGVLAADTDIDVTVDASSTATLGADFEFDGLSGALPQTTTITIPAGTYTSINPVPLGAEIAFDETYANLTNPPAVFPQGSFVAPVTGDYTLTLSADTFASGNAWVNVGTTFVTSGTGVFGSADVFNGLANGTADRISSGVQSQSFTISLVAGTIYHTTVGAGGSSNVSNVNLLIETPPVLSITGDTDVELDETVNLTLSSPQTGLQLADVLGGALIDSHVYTITNDDTLNVAINQANGQADPTNVDSADYEVVFSEAIDPSTFTAAEITLTGTSGTVTTGPTTTDNITWTFQVTGMTDGDTVAATILASAVQTSAGGYNDASTSTDNEVTYDTSIPTATVTIDAISVDTGVSSTDFITNDADGLTIEATLSADLLADEILEYSNDNGATWTDVTSSVTGTAVSYVDAALTSTETVQFRVVDAATNSGAVASQLVTILTTPPPAPVVNSPTAPGPITSPTPAIGTCTVAAANGTASFTTLPVGGLNPDPTILSLDANGDFNGTLAWTAAALGNTYDLVVHCIDAAGNPGPTTTVSPLLVGVSATDTDGDGVSDTDENTAPGGDGNGDGIPDFTQGHVASRPNPVTGAHVTLEAVGGCSFVNDYAVVAESSLSVQDDEFQYPVGLNDFQLACASPGDSADVTLYYDQVYDTADWDFRKFDDNGEAYADITSLTTFATADVNGTDVTTATYTVIDGGATDVDGIADGVINDPAGPAVSAEDLAETGQSTFVQIGLGAALVAGAVIATKTARSRSTKD